MTDILKRQPGETATGYAERMRDVVRVIQGRVSIEAGRWVDLDEAMEDLDWIIAQASDEQHKRLWSLQRAIGTRPTRQNVELSLAMREPSTEVVRGGFTHTRNLPFR